MGYLWVKQQATKKKKQEGNPNKDPGDKINNKLLGILPSTVIGNICFFRNSNWKCCHDYDNSCNGFRFRY